MCVRAVGILYTARLYMYCGMRVGPRTVVGYVPRPCADEDEGGVTHAVHDRIWTGALMRCVSPPPGSNKLVPASMREKTPIPKPNTLLQRQIFDLRGPVGRGLSE